MRENDIISQVSLDWSVHIYLLMIGNRPIGFIPMREGYTCSTSELYQNVKIVVEEKLSTIPFQIKKIGQDRPKPEKVTPAFSNKELKNVLDKIPHDMKAEVAKVFKEHQKARSSSVFVSDEKLEEFGIKLLNKLDEFIEQSGLSDFVNCFTLCGSNYSEIFKNRDRKKEFVSQRVAKSKSNFYSDLASSFRIDFFSLSYKLNGLRISTVRVPAIANKEMFEMVEKHPYVVEDDDCEDNNWDADE